MKNPDKPPLSPTKYAGRHKIYFPIVKLQHRRGPQIFSDKFCWATTIYYFLDYPFIK